MSEQGSSDTYEENERVLVHHQGKIYEAKVLKVEHTDTNNKRKRNTLYLIHYQGWKDKYDEWIDSSKMLKLNEKNKELQRKPLSSLKKKPNNNINQQHQQQQQQQQQHHSEESDDGRPTPTPSPSTAGTSTTTTTSTTSTSSTKRKRVDASVQESQRLDLSLPETLRKTLIDDWVFITNDKSLVALPRNPTVSDILDTFQQQHQHLEHVKQFADGIESYFNKALGVMLLYKFERPQFGEMVKLHPNKPMSEIYGAEHLLRLFVKLPDLLTLTELEDKTSVVLSKATEELIKYVEKNASTFFLKEYAPVTTYYSRLAN
ncbi:hypothetical protein SAMD00019534_068940 [Acytostelium subglobosum LB1]|uniref:hypothetical protein n=1 Tax=Acytostelium subglobosum LB1 TaxID=1410327 RepID=UPI000644F9D8|nr:hypothetical protein SAMD00019534_068940 [Acytostelium subglobosum LB1]GAM23719.1 hypothetical protein SAMD00019534_068940 [Acytostelium subglobosum LB1]|eukprot:XP_012753460.1 hypothetical protein SAMD00019534_068940 [Acytostelium subglobosum LB1]